MRLRLERTTPTHSLSYFAYFDDCPEEADVSSIIGTIAVVSALIHEMHAVIPCTLFYCLG